MTEAVELRDVTVRYAAGDAPALAIDALTIPAGQRVAVIGGSGAGKTTLLRLVNGLVTADTGRVAVLGADPAGPAARRREYRRRTGFVFQEFNLIERASVYRNVLCGRLGWMGPLPSLLGWYSDTDKALAMKAIAETGLEPFAARRVDSLSGGQRQRVAIARTLAQDPELLAADEPVSNLDPVLSADMLALIAGAGARRGATLVMVVHHPALAQKHAQRIIGLAGGRIVHDSDTGAALDAVALRTIYGRSLPPEPVPSDADDGDDRRIAPYNVA